VNGRASRILDHNLERLLTRAYEPVRMREHFRSALEERLVRACEARAGATARRQRPRLRALPLAGALAAAAALVLLLLHGSRLWPSGGNGMNPASLDELLARAGVAVREGSRAPWRAASAEELHSGFRISRPRLEVRTGEDRRASITARETTSLALGPRSGVLVENGDESDASATLLAGELSARLDPSQSWRIHAAESELRARGGELSVALVDASERAALAASLPEIAADRALARVHRSGGELAVATADLDVPPSGELEGYLQGNRWIAITAAPDTTASANDRSALATPPAPPIESGPPAWSLDGTLVLPTGSVLPERYRVWIRPLVSLPKVSLAERHECAGAEPSFHLQGTTGGPHLVQVEALGFAPWKSGEIELVPGTTIHLDVRLEPGAIVEGFVIDGSSGTPVAGALVVAERDVAHEVLALDGSFEDEASLPEGLPLACTRTDARGAFVLSHLSPGEHVLRATAAGFAAAWVHCSAPAPGARERCADLVLGAGARLHGTVHRGDGSAWSDAEIIAARIEIMASTSCISYGYAQTDAFGAYSLEHLPAGFYVVMNESQQPNTQPDWKRLEQIVLREGDDRELDFHPGSTTRTVSGTLRQPGGAPDGGVTIYLSADFSGEDWRGWSATSTDDAGHFEFQDVAAGSYGIYRSDGFGAGLHLLDLVEVGRAGAVDLDLTASPTRLGGVMRAARDGALLGQGILVLTRRASETADWQFAGKLCAQSTGRFAIEGLPEGEYMILALDAGERCAQARFGPYSLHGQSPLDLDLALEAGGAVVVRVVDAEGRPAAGVRVWAERGGQSAEACDPVERTAEDGTIRLGALLPGRWTLRTEQVDGGPAALVVDVLEGEHHSFELVLPAH
jgi:protocatechuate 3,4-dioxygenase beta subunit